MRVLFYLHCSLQFVKIWITNQEMFVTVLKRGFCSQTYIPLEFPRSSSPFCLYFVTTAENRKENRSIFTSAVLFGSKFSDSVQFVKVFLFWSFCERKGAVNSYEARWEPSSEMMWNSTDRVTNHGHKSMNAFERLPVSFLDICYSFQ